MPERKKPPRPAPVRAAGRGGDRSASREDWRVNGCQRMAVPMSRRGLARLQPAGVPGPAAVEIEARPGVRVVVLRGTGHSGCEAGEMRVVIRVRRPERGAGHWDNALSEQVFHGKISERAGCLTTATRPNHRKRWRLPMATSRICSIPGCDKKRFARGWCGPHWWRWRYHGDPLAKITANGEPSRYLKETVYPHTGSQCLIWPYARTGGSGAAHILCDGKTQYVARLVCTERYGPPPTPKHEAAHLCGNGHNGCVNPQHLAWKTHVDNEADKLRHGTLLRGERIGGSKLKEQDARDILALKGRLTQDEIAARFNVSQSLISAIHLGKRWGWLTASELLSQELSHQRPRPPA